jgi:hypothetical protein
MSLSVAGRFTTFPAAEAAAQQLFANGFVEEDVNLFFVNPRGQHAHAPADALHVPFSLNPAKHPGRGTIIGAVAGAVVGVALFTAISSSAVVALVAAGVGAYVGSMLGSTLQARANATPSIGETVRHAVHHERRDSGVLVAVHVTPDNQAKACDVLRSAGGQAIERWSDFDPTRPPVPVTELNQREA